jgi:tetratricopeptide (TPR) repeat protein
MEAEVQETAIDMLIRRGWLLSTQEGTWLRWQPDQEAVDLWEQCSQPDRTRARKYIEYGITQLVLSELKENDPSILSYLVPHLLLLTEVAINENDPDASDLCILLGKSFERIDQLGLARYYFERALTYWDGSTFSFDVMNDLKKLGDICEQLGDLAAARQYYEQVLKLEQDVYSETSPSIGMIFYRIGQLTHKQGDTDLALDYYNRCIQAFESIPGFPAAAVSLNAIGDILVDHGDIDKAKGMYERSMEIGRKLEGRDGGAAALVLHKLGIAELRCKDYEAARRCFERALAIRLELLEKNDPKIVDTLIYLARTCTLQGDTVSASYYMKQTFAHLQGT